MENTENKVNVTEEAVQVDKHEKFKEQSQVLIRKAISAIENLGKVSNVKNFEYSEDEVEKMFEALEEALEDIERLFKKKKEFTW